MIFQNTQSSVGKIIVCSNYKATNNYVNTVITWNGNENNNNIISLYNYIEKNADRLRSKYLEFIYDLEYLEVHGKRLSKYYELPKGYNLFWMSLISEKSPFKSPHILDCLKILALEEILITLRPKKIIFTGYNLKRYKAVKDLSRELGIECSWYFTLPGKNDVKFNFIRSLYVCVPQIMRTLLWVLRYIYSRRSFFNASSHEWNKEKGAIFFFSYFIALGGSEAKKGQYYSHQWGPLTELINTKGIVSNWMHHFLSSNQVKDPLSAINYTKTFSNHSKRKDKHNIFENFLTSKIIVSALKNYFKFLYISLTLPLNRKIFSPNNSKSNLWHFLKEDWYSSTRGTIMMQNLIWIELLDLIFKEIPQQKLGLYLQENQGWEIAFIHAWKTYNHGKLIGVAHSTVRYWDFRYFNHVSKKQCKIVKPQPDYTAINGLQALNCYIEANQKTDHLIRVEALRYLYLNQEEPRNKEANNINRKKKILVLGDIQRDLTISMVSALGLIDFSSKEFEFIFKPHPANIIEYKYLEGFKPKVTDQHLDSLFKTIDIVIASPGTSSGLEAYISQIPVITFLDASTFNLSALRGMEHVIFANTPDTLSNAINKMQYSKKNSNANQIFWLNKNLEGWKKLLSHHGYLNI